MKLSLNWIKKYIKIPKNLEVGRIVNDLTVSTVEIENVTNLGQNFENIVIGIIDRLFPHPNADRLNICKINLGNSDTSEIVCGGTNLKVGMKVVVAKPGSMVKRNGLGNLIDVKKINLRGVESFGMICASSEIGLSDLFPAAEGEVVDLSEFDLKIGTNLAEALDINDVIFEINNKSLSNRPDLWCHYGVAREISAIYNLDLEKFSPTKKSSQKSDVELKDTSLCQRYVCAKIEDISAKPSSLEIRTYLWRVGIRPVNCIVDITNYVMMATGQPLHAFDLKKIEGNIKVRCAYDSEKILLLDGKEISLCKEDLVVADKNGPLALAGIIGGKRGSISSDTSQILIEIANFDHVSVRRTAMRYKIRTESAVRNEKGIDLERCDIALTLALRMFENFFPSAIANFSDNYQRRSKIVKINVSLPWLEKNIDKNIEDSDIIKLNRLGFKINLTVDTMHVVVPSWRSTGDVSLPNDIMEEIIRIHGFENFKLKPIKILIENSVNQLAEDMDRKIREYLALRCGMNEIFTYPWISDEYIKAILPNEIDSMLSLSSPPSSDERYIRPSLVPGICKAVMKNLRFFDEFGLFESAHVFLNKNFESKYDLRESLPFQSRNVAGACVGNLKNITLLFRKAKGIISCLPRYVQLEALSFDKIEKPTWADDNLWINIIYNQKKIGDLALLSKKASLDCKIKNSALIIFELCIDSLKPYVSRTNKFIKICEYPETEHDISLLFDLSVKWEEIFDTIISKKYSIIRNVNFVDEYRGYHISDDKKSVTIRIKIGLLDRTLTSKEIETCIANIIDCLNKKFGAKIRC